MSAAELERVAETAQKLKELQATPDRPEALAAIPSLKLADLPKRNRLIPLAEERCGDTTILFHELPTNRVIYLDLAFDLHRLPGDLLPYVPLFGRALIETGVGEQDFVALSERIDRSTGGIYATPWTSATRAAGASAAMLVLRAKAMPDKMGELFGILEDVLIRARLDNRERFRQLVLETKSWLEASLVPSGSGFVNQRLRASLHEAAWASEEMGGISHLFFLRGLAKRIEDDWAGVQATLERIRGILIGSASTVCNVTTDAESWRGFEPRLRAFIANLPSARVVPAQWRSDARPHREALVVPAAVNFVGKGGNISRLGFEPTGAVSVVTNYLNTTWLWDKLRVQGGAYGASCGFDPYSGAFTFVSYRDPNVRATLDVYDKTPEFLRAAVPGETELTRNIIGVIGGIDTYLTPDAKGWTSMANRLIGATDEFRQRRREQVLGAGPADFRNLAQALSELVRDARVVVLGSEPAIAEARAQPPNDWQVTKIV